MGLGILTVQVVAVVGGHQRQVQILCHFNQSFVDRVLLRQGVFLDLDIVTSREQFAVPAGRFQGVFHPAPAALHGHLTLEAGRQRYQPFTVLLQQGAVDAGTVVEPLLEAG